MKIFNKIILPAIAFLLILSIASTIIIATLVNSEWEHCFDLKNRDKLAGSVELLICGASQGMNHYNTYTIDEQLGTCYNLSGPAMTWSAKTVVLEEELSRNNVRYVIIDISHNSLMQDPSVSGEYYGLPRVSKGSRIEYFFKQIDFSLWYELYGKLMNEGTRCLASKLLGENSFLGTTSINNCNYSDKGFRYNKSCADITLTETEIVDNYKIKQTKIDFPEGNIKNLQKMIELCKHYGAQPIIVQSFASDRLNWEYDGLEKLHNYLETFSVENNCFFIDGNLLKTRYSDFSDEFSFSDDQHLSGEGATMFSEKICEIIHLIEDNKEISELFYPSYSEMKADSPYMSYYLTHIKNTDEK